LSPSLSAQLESSANSVTVVSTGIPQEKIFIDVKHNEIKVMSADITAPEIYEIFKWHRPLKIN
jgi:hypothetical protein